jgi:hypothetical protein
MAHWPILVPHCCSHAARISARSSGEIATTVTVSGPARAASSRRNSPRIANPLGIRVTCSVWAGTHNLVPGSTMNRAVAIATPHGP